MAKAGHQLLVHKYYLDHLYEDIIVAGVKGPISKAAYWFNQRGLDEVVNTAGRTSVKTGQAIYKYIDQGLIEGTVNGSGKLSSNSGQELRRLQTGKVQQLSLIHI